MAIKIVTSSFFLAPVSSACYGDGFDKKHYTPIQYLKNYALCSCIADGYQSKTWSTMPPPVRMATRN